MKQADLEDLFQRVCRIARQQGRWVDFHNACAFISDAAGLPFEEVWDRLLDVDIEDRSNAIDIGRNQTKH